MIHLRHYREQDPYIIQLMGMFFHITIVFSGRGCNILDLKSFSTLFSQLMLPLLGILLGNLDKYQPFYRDNQRLKSRHERAEVVRKGGFGS